MFLGGHVVDEGFGLIDAEGIADRVGGAGQAHEYKGVFVYDFVGKQVAGVLAQHGEIIFECAAGDVLHLVLVGGYGFMGKLGGVGIVDGSSKFVEHGFVFFDGFIGKSGAAAGV